MSRHNRRHSFRRRKKTHNNVGIIVLISLVCLSIVATAFLVIGNFFHDRSLADNSSNTDLSSDAATADIKAPARSIKGYTVIMETSDSSTLTERLDGLITNGSQEASIPLNTKDGTMLYNSATAKEIGVTVGAVSVTAEAVTSAAKEREIYLCGVYYVNAFSKEDSLLRSVELSKNAAIVAEALNAGFDEVLIIAPQLSSDSSKEIIRFIDSIKALTNNGKIGLTVPNSILELEDSVKTSELISAFNEKADFLAIDFSGMTDTDAASQISEKINVEKLYLHMYKIRILLPISPDVNVQNSLILAVEENGINNWQILKY